MFIAYIYDPFRNPITQVFDLNKVSATLKLNGISDATFEISPNNPQAKLSVFNGLNKVKLSRIDVDGAETKVIEGEISLGTVQDTIQIQIKDFNNLFLDKKLLVDTTLNGPLDAFLVAEMGKINARSDTGFTVDCDVTAAVTLDTFKKGSSFYDVLQKIVTAGYEYTFADRKLIVRQTIGQDRTSGENYYQLIFDKNELNKRTIRNDKQVYNCTNLKNAIYDSNGNVLEDTESITAFGRREDWITTSATQTLSTYLSDRKQLVKEIEIIPIKLDFSEVNLGDVVACYIYKDSDIQYYNGSVKVTEKRITGSDLKKTEIKVSKGSVKTLDLFETIKQIQDKQRISEL